MIEAEINTKNVQVMIKRAPEVLKYELGDAMDHISKKFLKIFKKTRLQGPPGIKARTRGIFTRFKRAFLVSASIEGMGVEIFADSKIAKLHEEGGIVTDPAGGKLAVPLSGASELYTRGGVIKKKYKRAETLRKLTLIVIRGKSYLAKVKKKTGESTPLFVLKNKIRIRPRLGFYRTWQDLENTRIKILDKSVEKAIRRI